MGLLIPPFAQPTPGRDLTPEQRIDRRVGKLEDAYRRMLEEFNGRIDSENLRVRALTPGAIDDAAVTSRAWKPTSGKVEATGAVNPLPTTAVAGAGTDVPGATVTFTPETASIVLVTATFDFEVQPAVATTICVGELEVDNVPEAAVALLTVGNGNGGAIDVRATVTQTWRVPLTTAAHTLKLSARQIQVVGAVIGVCFATHTGFSYLVHSQ